MALKLVLPTRPLHTSIAPSLCKRQLHRLIKKLKALHLLDRLLRTLNRIKNNESLTLSLEICLCDYIDDLAIFGEEFGQSLLELVNLDALFEVAGRKRYGSWVSTEQGGETNRNKEYVSECNDTYVAFGGGPPI